MSETTENGVHVQPGEPLLVIDAALRQMIAARPETIPLLQAVSIWLMQICGSAATPTTASSDQGALACAEVSAPLADSVVETKPATDEHPHPEVRSVAAVGAIASAPSADPPTIDALATLRTRFGNPTVSPRLAAIASVLSTPAVRIDPDASLNHYRGELSMQQSAIEWALARDRQGFDSVREQYRRLCDRAQDEQCFMWALDQRVTGVEERRLEDTRDWYAVLGQAIDCYISDEPELGKSRGAFKLVLRCLAGLRRRLDWIASIGLHDKASEGLRLWAAHARERFAVAGEEAQQLNQPTDDFTPALAQADLAALRTSSAAKAQTRRNQKEASRKFVYELRRSMDSPQEAAEHVSGMRVALDNLRDAGGSAAQTDFVRRVDEALGLSNLPAEVLDHAYGASLSEALAALHEQDESEDEPEVAQRRYSPEVLRVREALAGHRVVIIGGDVRPNRKRAIEQAFGLAELDWVATRPHSSQENILPAISRDNVALVVLLIRWASHCYGDYRNVCVEQGKPFIRLPSGYGPNMIAAACIQQVGRQLGIA